MADRSDGYGSVLFRIVQPLPFYSGHAIFLAYAILTLSSWAARLLALFVLLDVVYFKVTYFQDATLAVGLTLGAFAGVLVRYAQFQASKGRS